VLTLTPGLQVLNERYRLIEPLDLGGNPPDRCRIWKAADAYDNEFLLKAWPFQGERPNDVDRALWDVELRRLFRLTSSPEAESRLVTLRDAGVDRAVKHLVMVLASPGLTTLEHLLGQRSLHRWLRDIRDIEVRREVWKGIRRELWAWTSYMACRCCTEQSRLPLSSSIPTSARRACVWGDLS
jgi:hypothetical protein